MADDTSAHCHWLPVFRLWHKDLRRLTLQDVQSKILSVLIFAHFNLKEFVGRSLERETPRKKCLLQVMEGFFNVEVLTSNPHVKSAIYGSGVKCKV